MTFLEFKNKMFDLACFNINQIYALRSDFEVCFTRKDIA